MEKEVKIFVGHFGSGKTEVALNFAQKLANKKKIAVIDLDVINSYFRSREVKDKLFKEGISVIAPENGLAFADLPIISPSVKALLLDSDYELIFDVGGDNLGATALGSLAPMIEKRNYEMSLVINPYRPYTKTLELAKKMLNELEQASRLKITAIISNPNYGYYTTLNDVVNGHRMVQELSDNLDIPLKCLCIAEHLLSSQVNKTFSTVEIFPLSLYMQPSWLAENF
ncbi:MAG TPA: MinD/ParA family protein [Clostridia bacterium]|nr:MinD/ParA family protein [Clostridia bacterium]